METNLGKRWKKEVGTGEAPDNWTLGPRCYTCGKQGGGSPVDGPRAAARKFMQRAIGETASWKNGVDIRYPKRDVACGP